MSEIDPSILPLLSLPRQTLVYDVLPRLPLSTLKELCLLSPQFIDPSSQSVGLCDDPNLWITKLNMDYPGIWETLAKSSNLVSVTIIPKELYLFLYDSNRVPVIYHGDRIGFAYVNRSRDSLHMFIANPEQLSAYSGIEYSEILELDQPDMFRILNSDLSRFLVFQMYPTYMGRYILFLGPRGQTVQPQNLIKNTYPTLVVLIADFLGISIGYELAHPYGHPPIHGYVFQREGEPDDLLISDSRSDWHREHGIISYVSCNLLSKSNVDDLLGVLSGYSNVPSYGGTLSHQSACEALKQQLKMVGHFLGTYSYTAAPIIE